MTHHLATFKKALLGKQVSLSIVLLVVVSITFGVQIRHSQAEDVDTSSYQVEFPSMFHHDNWLGSQFAKIVTESSYAGSDSITIHEEYIDLQTIRYAYVASDTKEVIYSSSHEQVLLKYKPYTCESYALDYQILQDVDDSQMFYGEWRLRLFGLVAIWLEAQGASKSYAKNKQSYGTGDLNTLTHKWRFRNSRGNFVTFYFSNQLMLERVEIANMNGSILKTIKVLSIEYEGDDNYEEILSIPAGFDCAKSIKKDKKKDEPKEEDEQSNTKAGFWSKYFFTESLVKLEVTGTKTNSAGDKSTDTVYVELAHAFVGDSITWHNEVFTRNHMHLTKIKSKQQETRTILNHLFDVKYHIDLRSGECSMSHLSYDGVLGVKERELANEARDDLLLKFANGLEFPFHERIIKMFFSSEAPFLLLKRIDQYNPDQSEVQYMILERPSFEWPYASKSGEKMVAYVLATVVAHKLATGERTAPKLQSITVSLLSVDRTKILETYHISVVDDRGPLQDWPDVAGLFDVSEECYLNDPAKRSGLDYAWLELFYPVSSRVMDKLLDSEFQLKQTIYRNLMASPLLSSFNLPHFELMFSDEGLIVRMLLLDVPPFETLFDSKKNTKLVSSAETDQVRFIMPNERHCARMCQLHDCLAMSFCQSSNECLISAKHASLNGQLSAQVFPVSRLEKADDCVTFSVDWPELLQAIRKQRLANVISELQNQDYDLLDLPEMPEELTLARDEIEPNEADRLAKEYVANVGKYLQDSGRRMPSLTLMLMVNDHLTLVLPTSFSVENNPLEEFSLDYGASGSDSNSDDVELHDPQQIVKFFHAGMPGFRFDPAKVMQTPQDKSDHQARTVRSLPGLTYDQCALACLDSKCGVFSHCEHSNACLVSNLATVQEAEKENLLTLDRDCLVSQRDYAQHFQKFDNVQAPKESEKALQSVVTVNDCAANCVTETGFNCFSFEVCKESKENAKLMCYLHDHRRTDSMELYGSRRNDTATQSKLQCDHYERSFLAEFTAIELHSIKKEQLVKLKTTEYVGKTTFECADICLNQLADCSAFEFCFQSSDQSQQTKLSFAQSCTMVQSKPDGDAQPGAEYIVEDDRPDSVFLRNEMSLRPDSGLLESSRKCHVFALKPNTIQAHLRSLALGQTMTRHEKTEQDNQRRAAGVVFSMAGLLLFVLSLALLSGLASFGLCWAREKSDLVRVQMDRAQAALSKPLSRFRQG